VLRGGGRFDPAEREEGGRQHCERMSIGRPGVDTLFRWWPAGPSASERRTSSCSQGSTSEEGVVDDAAS
jgi:hypothetical protein